MSKKQRPKSPQEVTAYWRRTFLRDIRLYAASRSEYQRKAILGAFCYNWNTWTDLCERGEADPNLWIERPKPKSIAARMFAAAQNWRGWWRKDFLPLRSGSHQTADSLGGQMRRTTLS